MSRRFRNILLPALCAVIVLAGTGHVAGGGYVELVDPFIGTDGHGHTYPGAVLPFGMVQLSPDTRLSGWDGCSGYHYSDSYIYGFTHTHLSGTGCSDYGDILFMPVTGEASLTSGSGGEKGYRSLFTHKDEEASPGYYSVMLLDYGIMVELTATPRCGLHRYHFPSGSSASVVIDLSHRDSVIESGLAVVGDSEIEGFRRSDAWARDQHVYFVARFSRPMTGYRFRDGTGSLAPVDGSGTPGKKNKISGSRNGKDVRAAISFGKGGKEPLVVKVGISAVSIEGARKNLESEAGEWDFDAYREKAKQAWSSALGRIRVRGGSEARRKTFYSALYHCMLAPNLYMDADGRYRGRDLEVHTAEGFDYYTVFSLWDTYRASHPLFTIIEPERTVDFIKTFLTQYREGGMLPVWELAANETGCMIGYHAVPVIADAWVKGIRGFDSREALEAMRHSAMQDHLGLEYYRKFGFIPSEQSGQSVSRTLEYAYDDWCIAMMAGGLGEDEIYREFIRRAQYYKNVYDPSTGFMRARMNGGWVVPFDPDEVNYHYTEANAWQYSFYVPQDISGLARLMGGMASLEGKLDELFAHEGKLKGFEAPDVTGLIGQYAHGNEPSQHMAYLYNFTGSPWKTQARVREIMDGMYGDQPSGLCGNEDCGQMSAWYVFSAIGFYPVTPGQDRYIIGSPLFERVEIDTGNGNTFTVVADGVSGENIYIHSASLNGKDWKKSWISHKDIADGGELVFEMESVPSKQWGTGKGNVPLSSIEDGRICPVPSIEPAVRSFTGSLELSLSCALQDALIRYTLDGSEPGPSSPLYDGPIGLHTTTELKARAFADGFQPSDVLVSRFQRIEGDVGVTLGSEYNSMYTGGGALGLVDMIRGAIDFRTGGWQGYRGVDFEAVLDLKKIVEISSISAGFLHDQKSWIFMPRWVEFAVSADGSGYETVARLESDVDDRQEEAVIREIATSALDVEARYVRVRAASIGLCPEWHVGAGGKGWIFIDEITVGR